MSKREVDIRLKQLNRQCQNLEEQISSLESLVDGRIKQLRKTLANFRALEDSFLEAVDEYKVVIEREGKLEARKLQKKLDEVETAAARGPRGPLATVAEGEVEKAQTLAIFDSIIFAMSNWSTEGDTAPDFELACQSVLFPVVYERVMSGDSDYYMNEVPCSAVEVVKRGREYVKHLREVCSASLVDPDTWTEHANSIQQWWIRDALPLLYGGRSEQWDEDSPLSLTAALEWRDQPASRALHFPLIWDGMELVSKHRDQIRDTTGLPDFNRNTLQTRLQP